MTWHVYTRIAGFRLAVIPRAPFRISRSEAAPNAIDVEYRASDGTRFARLIPVNGGYSSKISQQTESLHDVLDVEAGPDLDHWRLETTVFTCAWPLGYAVFSPASPQDPLPFDLLGMNQELIYIQAPRRIPPLEEMCGPNQRVQQLEQWEGGGFVVLEYSRQGQPWCQRHEIVKLPDLEAVVTLQAPASVVAEATIAAVQVASSMAVWEEPQE